LLSSRKATIYRVNLYSPPSSGVQDCIKLDE